MKQLKSVSVITALLFFAVVSIAIFTAEAAQPVTPKPAAAINDKIIKYTPGMTTQSVAGRPDTDIIEFPNGRVMSVGQLRRWEAAAAKLRAPRVDRTPAAVKIKPNPGNIKMSIKNANDLSSVLNLPDNETVQLPSGQLATVGQIKLVQPYVERKLGRKLTQIPTGTALKGPAIKVSKETPLSEWKNISKMSDETVLETPNGARITVGTLRQEAAKVAKSRGVSTKTLPTQGSKGRSK